jgi:hypothetical protein
MFIMAYCTKVDQVGQHNRTTDPTPRKKRTFSKIAGLSAVLGDYLRAVMLRLFNQSAEPVFRILKLPVFLFFEHDVSSCRGIC